MVGNQNVLRLQVPVVDPKSMAVLNGIQNLKKDSLGEIILTHILSAFGDVVEQISFRAILHDNVGAVMVIDDFEHRDHVGVCRGRVVQPYLPGLERDLSSVQRSSVGVELAEALHGILYTGLDVDGRIDDSVGTRPQYAGQLQGSGQEAS